VLSCLVVGSNFGAGMEESLAVQSSQPLYLLQEDLNYLTSEQWNELSQFNSDQKQELYGFIYNYILLGLNVVPEKAAGSVFSYLFTQLTHTGRSNLFKFLRAGKMDQIKTVYTNSVNVLAAGTRVLTPGYTAPLALLEDYLLFYDKLQTYFGSDVQGALMLLESLKLDRVSFSEYFTTIKDLGFKGTDILDFRFLTLVQQGTQDRLKTLFIKNYFDRLQKNMGQVKSKFTFQSFLNRRSLQLPFAELSYSEKMSCSALDRATRDSVLRLPLSARKRVLEFDFDTITFLKSKMFGELMWNVVQKIVQSSPASKVLDNNSYISEYVLSDKKEIAVLIQESVQGTPYATMVNQSIDWFVGRVCYKIENYAFLSKPSENAFRVWDVDNLIDNLVDNNEFITYYVKSKLAAEKNKIFWSRVKWGTLGAMAAGGAAAYYRYKMQGIDPQQDINYLQTRASDMADSGRTMAKSALQKTGEFAGIAGDYAKQTYSGISDYAKQIYKKPPTAGDVWKKTTEGLRGWGQLFTEPSTPQESVAKAETTVPEVVGKATKLAKEQWYSADPANLTSTQETASDLWNRAKQGVGGITGWFTSEKASEAPA
ncbi:MAG: hypothetical protein WBQ73_02150, partial [Candidatus Babeliales bacterium]